jgi:hypothetical protein
VKTGLRAPTRAGGWVAPRVEAPADDGPPLWWWVMMIVAGAAWLADGWPW